MVSVQRCDDCGLEQPLTFTGSGCPACGGLLAVVHSPPTHGDTLRGQLDAARHNDPDQSGVWRFADIVFPCGVPARVSHPEGNTPLLHRESVAEWAGVHGLLFKHEGHNPTGSFKDRGMTVAVTHARLTGATAVACASTGNTSASLAAYAAQAGIPALVFVPEGKVAAGKLAQTAAYGARTLIIPGDFDACLRLAREACDQLGVRLLNSVNPFRLEGQKTIVLELLQQLAWNPPDWIVFPAGNLGNTSAFGKALIEAHAWGLIERIPRLAAVQAAGAAPFAAAFQRQFDRLVPVDADTVASAIRIGDPASYSRAVGAIRGTEGVVCAVTDTALLDAKSVIDRAGIGCEPASAAALAGTAQLVRDGVIRPSDRVVAILTGHLLKDPDPVGTTGHPMSLRHPPIKIAASVRAVAEILEQV